MRQRFHYLGLLLAACAVVGTVYGQASVVQPSAKPDYSQEPYIIERNSTEATFENDGTGTRKTSGRVRIQSEAGVQRFAVLTFAYQNSNETIHIDFVRVAKPDGTVVTTPSDSVQDMASDIARAAPLYSDSREKHVAVKGLGIGDVLDFEVQWNSKPLAPGQFWFSYDQSQGDIVLEEILKVSVPRERLVKWSSPTSKPVIAEQENRRTFTWTHSRLEHKSKEQEQKDVDKLTRQVLRGTVPQQQIQISTFQKWEDISRWYGSLQSERAKPTPEIRAKAAELTKGLTDDNAKAHAIYKYVSSQIHYIGIDLGIGRYQPHAATEVMANQYGDCKDKHTLLAALLDAVGIQAYPALISSVRSLDVAVPSPGQFDHVVSVIILGGVPAWVDTTPEVASFGYLMSSLRGKQALLVTTANSPALRETPADPPRNSLQTFRIDAKLSDAGVLQGKIDRTLQNDDAEVALRAAYRRVSMMQWKDLTQQISFASGFSGDVSEVTATPDKTEEPLRLAYSYDRKDYPDWKDRQLSSPLPPHALPLVPEKAETPEAVWLGSPREERYESHIELPKGYRPTLPKNIELTEKFADYHRSYEFKEGILIARRSLTVKVNEVPVNEYEAYKKFTKRVTDDYDLKVPLWSGSTPALAYQDEIWTLPFSQNAEANRAYDDAREKYTRSDIAGQLASVKRAVELDPQFTRAWLWLGEIYKEKRQFDEALAAYRTAIKVDPEQVVSYKALGSTLLGTQKAEEAVTIWNQLIKLQPGERAGPEGLGLSLMNLKRYAEAQKALTAAVQINPNSSNIWTELGKAQLKTGEHEQAVLSFRKAVELAPQPWTLNIAAYALAEANQEIPLALEFAKRAVADEGEATRHIDLSQVSPEDPNHPNALASFWDTLGWVYLKAGQTTDAEKYLNASWALSQLGVVAGHLGEVYEHENKKQAAVRMYRFALNRIMGGFTPKEIQELARQRLEKLAPDTPSSSAMVSLPIADEISRMRTTKMPLLAKGEASAEFFVVFTREANKPSTSIEAVKFISGSDALKDAEKSLKASDLTALLPDEGVTRLLRRGILSCSPHVGCSFTFLNAFDVRP